MPMFRFWASDSRASEQIPDATHPIDLDSHLHGLSNGGETAEPNGRTPKRRRPHFEDDDVLLNPATSVKRARLETDHLNHLSAGQESEVDRRREVIQHQFGLEILLKHDELRLINQELAKCQIALEQLRRCHLIPYPINCPTPDQMLNVSSGKGFAAQSSAGEAVPKWAPPFGVADGPYARHYAKWLIPDPSFDGMQPEWQFTPEATQARNSFADGRTTRNSFGEPANTVKARTSRGISAAKLQSLSSGYPQPKEKAGPCVLKRADGQTVKLVCIDCNRENFSSTQGFINHCRIAHKRDFKSHEEAAVQSGHPVEAAQSTSVASMDKSTPATPAPSSSATVHPFARPDMTEQQAYAALRSRIADSLELYRKGLHPMQAKTPVSKPAKTTTAQAKKGGKFGSAPETPYLSRLMQSRKFNGNLRDLVTDARTKVSLEDITPGEESDIEAELESAKDATVDRAQIMRVPARTTKSPAPVAPSTRPPSSKSRLPHMALVSPPNSTMGFSKDGSHGILSDEDMDMEDANLSPNTLISNNAPSLVSDDGEYDDSDGSSVSARSDSLEAESVSDVAEISLDDEQEPRSLGRGPTAVRLRKEDEKHVTFMSPVPSDTKQRRARKA